MDFGTAVKTCFKKYFVFSGRARRSEYWWFVLFTIIVSLVASVLDGIIFGFEASEDGGPINTIWSLAIFIPSLSAGFRRLHDTGRSGWWIGGGYLALIGIGMLVGALGFSLGVSGFGTGLIILLFAFVIGVLGWAITIIVFCCLDGHPSSNQYGPSPKYDTGAQIFD